MVTVRVGLLILSDYGAILAVVGGEVGGLAVVESSWGSSISANEIELFEAPPELDTVQFRSEELTAFNPGTGMPNHYTVIISYDPDAVVLESASLTRYLASFREVTISPQMLTATIARELSKVAGCSVKVTTHQRARWGMDLRCEAQGVGYGWREWREL